jgi:hypothetical protein
VVAGAPFVVDQLASLSELLPTAGEPCLQFSEAGVVQPQQSEDADETERGCEIGGHPGKPTIEFLGIDQNGSITIAGIHGVGSLL